MTLYLLSGFETGDTSEVVVLGTGNSVVATTVGDAGAYRLQNAASNTGTAGSTLVNTFNSSRIFFSFRFMVDADAPTANWETDFAVQDTAGANCAYGSFIYDAVRGQWAVQLGEFVNGNRATTYFPSSGFGNVWHNVDIDISIGASVTNTFTFDGYTIGTDPFSLGGNTPNQAGNYGTVNVGRVVAGNQQAITTNKCWLDDFVYSSTAVFTGARVIARQFTTTTAYYSYLGLYDSINTGTTMADVWNATPFSAAAYLQCVAAGLAQGARTSTFASTQSGHGSGTIGGSDTFIGAHAALIAKTAATTAAGVTQVGTAQFGSSTAGGDITLTFSVAPQAGDLIVVTGGHILRTGTTYGPTTAGYSAIGTLQTSGSSGTGLAFGAWCKIVSLLDAAADTTVVCAGTATAGDGVGYTARIFRQSMNLDAILPAATYGTPVWSAAVTAGNPDPPNLTGMDATWGYVVIAAAASLVSDTNIGGATNYTSQATANAAATRPFSTSSLHRILAAGGTSENPPAIGSTGNAWSSGLNIALTVGIRVSADAGSVAWALINNGTSQYGWASAALATTDTFYCGAGVANGDLDTGSANPFSLTILNSIDATYLHGNHSLRQQVEDAWVFAAYIPSAATAWDGTAAFAGVGSLAALVSLRLQAIAGFAGTGSLSASTSLARPAVATFAGAGNLSATATRALAAFVNFAGSGSLSATAQQTLAASASFNGAGNLSVTTKQALAASASFAGAGTLSATASLALAALAAFAGAGNLAATASSVTIWQGTAVFAGSGNLAATASLAVQAAAAFAGAGSLSAIAGLALQAAATFAGSGSLSASAQIALAASVGFAGAGTLSVTVSVALAAFAAFAGAGNLTATGSLALVAAATFAGSGTLTATGSIAQQASATFAGAGKLAALASLVLQGSASFAGAGNLAVLVSLRMQASASFAGSGNLAATVSSAVAASAVFAGVGNLAAAAQLTLAALAAFAGAGSMSASTIQTMQVAATFAGAGSLDATVGAKAQAASAVFAGAGNLSAATSAQVAAFANFAGAGNLAVTASLALAARATLAGAGSLAATANQAFAALATLAGQGNLSATISLALTAAANFAGTGNLSATTVQAMQVAATFAGAGNFSATAQAAQNWQATAVFAGTGNLSATTRLGLTALATFSGAGSLSALPSGRYLTNPAAFAGSGALSVTATLALRAFATFAGSGSLAATAQAATAWQATAVFAGAGSLSIITISAQRASAAFAGTGNLSALARLALVGAATFSGQGSLSASVSAPSVNNAVFAGAGVLSALARLALAARANLQGSGSLVALLAQRYVTNPAVIAGAGTLAVNATFPAIVAGGAMGGNGGLCIRAYVRPGPPGRAQNKVVTGAGATQNVLILGAT